VTQTRQKERGLYPRRKVDVRFEVNQRFFKIHANCYRSRLVASQASSAVASETRETHLIAITSVELKPEQREWPGLSAQREPVESPAQQLREEPEPLLVRRASVERLAFQVRRASRGLCRRD
jgi:hypothetical protein